MMPRAAAVIFGILVLSSSTAWADPVLPLQGLGDEGHAAESEQGRRPEDCGVMGPCSAVEPGYFNGLGAPGRAWEMRVDGAFSSGGRIAPERYGLARFFTVTRLIGVVARTDFTSTFDTSSSGGYSLQGPLLSLGLRARSKDADSWLEFGFRFLSPSANPNTNDPSALTLALKSTLASGQADDALWLNFESWGYQVYLAMQSRTRFPWLGGNCTLGSRYGGQTSLSPLAVATWLGPQKGVVGNAYVDFFVGAQSLAKHNINLELGIHSEGSLSSIWPGSATFPVAIEGYVAWSPKTWVAIRAFGGYASTIETIAWTRPFGLRLVFYTDSGGAAPPDGSAEASVPRTLIE